MWQSLVIAHRSVHFMAMLEGTTNLHGLEYHHHGVLATLSMYHLMGMHLQMLLSIWLPMLLPRLPLILSWMLGTTMTMASLLKIQISATGTSPMLTKCIMVPTTMSILEVRITYFRVTGTCEPVPALFFDKWTNRPDPRRHFNLLDFCIWFPNVPVILKNKCMHINWIHWSVYLIWY